MGNVSTKLLAVFITPFLPGAKNPNDATLQGARRPPPKAMDPEDSDSTADVVLRILSKHAKAIEAGMKNHEYRTYRLRDEVKYVWLYEDDIEAIRLVITVAGPKRPGEVNDPTGDGNEDFDRGLKVSDYGYPILAVNRLPYAVTRAELLEEYGIDMAKGRQYAKQTLVDAFPIATLNRAVPKNM